MLLLAMVSLCLASALAGDAGLPPSNTPFAFKLYAELLKKDEGKNLCISPFSISTALAMTLNGAAGTTREGMEKALGLQGLGPAEINHGFSALMESLQGDDPKLSLGIANSLWARKGVTFRDEFLKSSLDSFKARATALDFGDPKTPDAIDAWVKERTHGRIPFIAPRPIDRDAMLFLINAVYFNGPWAVPFEKGRTKEMPFIRPDGSKKSCALMARYGDFSYLKEGKFQAVSLPYGQGRLEMLVFLPDEGFSLKEFHAILTPDHWADWLRKFYPMEGSVALPRFKAEYGAELGDVLKALGMGDAFDGKRADFSGMRPERDLFISSVMHKTFVEVNEEGTEAAAATLVAPALGDRSPSHRAFRMCCDRPFFYAIRDTRTGTLLFMGSVSDPG